MEIEVGVMSNLNYFMPYRRAEGHHENALTRAFMTTMRFSPSLLLGFYQMVRDSLHAKGVPPADTPSMHELDMADVVLDSQRGGLGKEVKKIVSVLITNDDLPIDRVIEPIDRKAVYDGLVTFGQEITLFIENKPRNGHVRPDQLCPNKEDVAEDTMVVPVVAVVSWRHIVDLINSLSDSSMINGSERNILADLRGYMWEHHGHLNPYRTFGLCGNNPELLELRIESLLREVAVDPGRVEFHRGWAYYIGIEGYPGIEQVGLVLRTEKDGMWRVDLFLAFADTIKQARRFYTLDIKLAMVDDLRSHGWDVRGHFHLSHMQKHLYWYPTDAEKVQQYIEHWKKNVSDIHQYHKDEISAILGKLFERSLLTDNDEMRAAFKKYVQNTNRTRINMAPGLVLQYSWSSGRAVDLDAKGEFRDELMARIREGFRILDIEPSFLKR